MNANSLPFNSVPAKVGLWMAVCLMFAVHSGKCDIPPVVMLEGVMPAPERTFASLSPRVPFPAERSVLACKEGCATYYSRSLHGGKTAEGGRVDLSKLAAAHRSYPFGTIVRVTRVKNGKSVDVRVNDRLPSTRTNDRLGIIIDLTHAAASKLDMMKDGRVKVKVEVLEWGGKKGKGKPTELASNL